MVNSKTGKQSNKTVQFLYRAVFQISRTINIVGLVMAALMTLFIVADVIGRYLFNRPITGSFEILAFMMAILVAFGLAYTAVRGGHISIDLVMSRFAPRIQAVISSITSLLCLGVFTAITWQTVLNAESLKLGGAASQMLLIPSYPFLYALAFGSAIMCFVFIYNIFEHFSKVIEGAHWLVCAGLLFLIILVLVVFTIPFWGQGWLPELSHNTVGIFGICLLFVLLFSGIPVAIAMALVGFLGIAYLGGVESGLGVLKAVPYDTIASYSLIAIPLFLLMTAFMQQSGIAQAVYLAATSWFGHLPGGLALSSVTACALNSTTSASSQSNAAAVGAVALPKMREYNYNLGLSTGSIAAGGAIALLIPPSVGIIIYAILTEQSISKLFCAGLIPGALMSVLFMLYVLLAGCFSRNLAPKGHAPSGKQSVIGFIMLLPLGVWLIPLAGMLGGIFTPAEAAAFAALIAFIMAVIWTPVWGRPILSILHKSLIQAVHTTCMIALIFIGASIFGMFLAMTRLPATFTDSMVGLRVPPLLILAFIFLVYILLGCFMEPLTLMVFSLPILSPMVFALGFDPAWFGVVLMLFIGIGMLTQLVRMNWRLTEAFTMGYPLKVMITGVVPFAILMVILLCLLVVFPQLALWLPNLIL